MRRQTAGPVRPLTTKRCCTIEPRRSGRYCVMVPVSFETMTGALRRESHVSHAGHAGHAGRARWMVAMFNGAGMGVAHGFTSQQQHDSFLGAALTGRAYSTGPPERPPIPLECHKAVQPAVANPGHEKFCFRPNALCDAASKVIDNGEPTPFLHPSKPTAKMSKLQASSVRSSIRQVLLESSLEGQKQGLGKKRNFVETIEVQIGLKVSNFSNHVRQRSSS